MNEKIKFLKSVPQFPQKSQEWIDQRKDKLTSSDVATAIGLNPYEKPDKLLFKKCHVGPKFTGNAATKHGEKYESEAIDIYCKLMNKTNYEFGLISYDSVNPIRKHHYDIKDHNNQTINLDFLAGSPDGVAVDNDDHEDLVLLEVKCPMRRKIQYGQVPEYYLPQVIYNMVILDINKADFIEYVPSELSGKEPEFNIVRVHKNDEWFMKSILIAYEFWSRVVEWRSLNIKDHPLYMKYKEHDPESEVHIEFEFIEFR